MHISVILSINKPTQLRRCTSQKNYAFNIHMIVIVKEINLHIKLF